MSKELSPRAILLALHREGIVVGYMAEYEHLIFDKPDDPTATPTPVQQVLMDKAMYAVREIREMLPYRPGPLELVVARIVDWFKGLRHG